MIAEIWGCQSWLADRKVIKHTHVEYWHPRSTGVHTCDQIEQVAHWPAIILRGLSGQAVTIRCLLLDKHTHTHTPLPSCCSSAWSVERGADECSPDADQQVEKSRRLDGRDGCVSAPPPAGKVGVFNPNAHFSYNAMQHIEPGGNTNRPWPCTPCVTPQRATTPLKCALLFQVTMAVPMGV